jgi:hypothetical protein
MNKYSSQAESNQAELFRIRMLALPGDHSRITDEYAWEIEQGLMSFDPETDLLRRPSGWETMVTDGGVLNAEYYETRVKGRPQDEILKHRHNLRNKGE